MDKQFKSITDFTDYFKDEEACQNYFEQIRFKDGEYCPHCGHAKIYRYKNSKRLRCAKCKKDFTIKTGTIFGESKISFRKWFVAIYLLTSNKKGISSIQLAQQVGVTQKTAWFMDHRIRKAMKQGNIQLFGNIEADETYVGGKEKNKHFCKRIKGTQGRNTKTKTPVMGILERKGKVKATVLGDVKMRTIEQQLVNHVGIGSKIYTDDFKSYSKIGKLYPHEAVKHGHGEYVNKKNREIHTNNIESFWAIFKRGYGGIYHSMSRKHMQKYVDEFSYRFNLRGIEFEQMFCDLVNRVSSSKQLSYKNLTK